MKFFEIQALRGVAVLIVCVFHMNQDLLPGGYLGVDIFFVISGFVVTNSLINRTLGRSVADMRGLVTEFFRARFIRLVPALAGTTAIMSAAFFLFGPTDAIQRSVNMAASAFVGISNFVAPKYQGDYFSPSNNGFAHLWSLSVEEQFYFLIGPALILTLLAVKSLIGRLATLLLVVGFFLGALVGISLFLTESLFFEDAYFFSGFRFLQIGLGVIAALVWKRIAILDRRGRIMLPMALGLVILIEPAMGHAVSAFLVALISAFSLIALPPQSEPGGWKLTWLSHLGDRSYSIYLLHLPLAEIIKFQFGFSGTTSMIGTTLWYVAILGVLSEASYRYLETPYRSGVQKRVTLAPVMGLALLALVGTLSISATTRFVLPDLLGFGQDKDRLSSLVHGDCPRLQSGDAGPTDPCMRHEGDGLTLLLISDSTGLALIEPMTKFARERELTFFSTSKSECQWKLPESYVSENWFSSTNWGGSPCAWHNVRTLQWISRNPGVVVLYSYTGQEESNSEKNIETLSSRDSFDFLLDHASALIALEPLPHLRIAANGVFRMFFETPEIFVSGDALEQIQLLRLTHGTLILPNIDDIYSGYVSPDSPEIASFYDDPTHLNRLGADAVVFHNRNAISDFLDAVDSE